MKIKTNKKYLSSLIANAEIHAGGLFFCILYQNCLEFFNNGNVEFTKQVVDAFRPMDENDVKYLENYKITGKYYYNESGYLICEFDDLFWTFTGLGTEKNNNIVPFVIYDSRLSKKWSEVYILKEME